VRLLIIFDKLDIKCVFFSLPLSFFYSSLLAHFSVILDGDSFIVERAKEKGEGRGNKKIS